MDDPGADGWETEVIHDLLKKKLGKLAELIVAEEFSAELQAPLVAEEIESSALVPIRMGTVLPMEMNCSTERIPVMRIPMMTMSTMAMR